MPAACQEISSLVASKAATLNLNWVSWTGLDCELVNAINVDKHTAWLKLEIIAGVEFHVCFGSLYWLNAPDESSLFVPLCCVEMAWEASWHFECWLSLYTKDGAFSSFLGREDSTGSLSGSWRTRSSVVDHSFSAHLFVMSWKTQTRGCWIELSPWWVSYRKSEWGRPKGN